MRWRFVGEKDSAASVQKVALMKRIDSWWDAFSKNAVQIDRLFSKKAKFDLPEWMHTHLGAVNPSLMWEYGPAVNGSGHRLVITPESARHLRPLTTTLMERAPKIAGWEFYPYRLPEDVESAFRSVEARVGREFKGVSVNVRAGQHHCVDVEFFSEDFASSDTEANHAAFVFAESLLGEECLDKWIGVIEGKTIPKKGLLHSVFSRGGPPLVKSIPLERFKETVDSLIGSIQEQLSDRPYFESINSTQWWSYSRSPDISEDYIFDHDIIAGMTSNRQLYDATRLHSSFYSERFSRCGEVFCYLKIDGTQRVDHAEVAYRAEISDALDAMLIRSRLGCSVGGGTGKRYSYISLALLNIEEAIISIRELLRSMEVPKRTWILFYDAHWIGEWVGIYDDSSAPLMPEFEE